MLDLEILSDDEALYVFTSQTVRGVPQRSSSVSNPDIKMDIFMNDRQNNHEQYHCGLALGQMENLLQF